MLLYHTFQLCVFFFFFTRIYCQQSSDPEINDRCADLLRTLSLLFTVKAVSIIYLRQRPHVALQTSRLHRYIYTYRIFCSSRLRVDSFHFPFLKQFSKSSMHMKTEQVKSTSSYFLVLYMHTHKLNSAFPNNVPHSWHVVKIFLDVMFCTYFDSIIDH